MLRKLISAFTDPAPKASPVGAVPPGERVYAVGDIHGRLDLLDELLARIEADNAARDTADTTLIFLGDLIDRGPDSAQVVQRLLDLSRHASGIRFLLGNHEEVFLKAMKGDAKALAFSLRIGGKPTVLSYGINEADYNAADYSELLDLLRARVPAAHLQFLTGFEDLIVIGDYAFVHAGIQPGLALDAQVPATLRWIREEFLTADTAFEKIIVHGHSIVDNVEERVSRIGIDTGAYATGRLTAMGFENSNRWILQTNGLPNASRHP